MPICLAPLALCLPVLAALSTCPASVAADRPRLRFDPSGRFKIAQFSDIHNSAKMDPRTTAAMGKVLDAEKPNLVVLTGDSVSTSDCADAAELREAIRLVAIPMERRGIPWAMVFGNHDTDDLAKFGLTKAQVYRMLRAYAHNVSPPTAPNTYGMGNALLRVAGPKSDRPAFGVWLIDSNAYARGRFGGQELDTYDWIHSDQVAWYVRTSKAAEAELGRKLPGLMFCHICLPEYAQVAASKEYTGERHEAECPSSVNGGMFAALLERRDVLGVAVGHDHTNTYEGRLYGIALGYGGSIGWAAYGLKGDTEAERHRLRGSRIFTIDEAAPARYESRYVTVNSLP
ncbi:MAG: metallophosphoesterase family protein [Armatimonadetes bacterium]|nr:metallophosphoesterase family protein [Armatimonadota bacterium]